MKILLPFPKAIVMLSMCLSFVFAANLVKGQTEEQTDNYWKFLAESATLVDVQYRFVECNGQNQIHLYLLNENAMDQVAHFELTIQDGGNTFTHTVNYKLNKGDIVAVFSCEADEALDALRIDLPDGYSTETTRVNLSFIE